MARSAARCGSATTTGGSATRRPGAATTRWCGRKISRLRRRPMRARAHSRSAAASRAAEAPPPRPVPASAAPTGKACQENTGDLQGQMRANYTARPCEYAVDALKADGIRLMTSYQRSRGHRPRQRGGAAAAAARRLKNGEDETMNGLSREFVRGCVCCPPTAPAPGARRRNFIAGGLATLGLAAAAPPARVFAQAASPAGVPGPAPAVAPPPRIVIDVHHHIAPPAYAQELIARGQNEPPLFRWSVQKSLDDMDKAGVATAITSITTPG